MWIIYTCLLKPFIGAIPPQPCYFIKTSAIENIIFSPVWCKTVFHTPGLVCGMECVGRLGESFVYESQQEVYIAYNFVIKACRVVVILLGEFIFMHLSYVSSVEPKSLWPQIKIWLQDGYNFDRMANDTGHGLNVYRRDGGVTVQLSYNCTD